VLAHSRSLEHELGDKGVRVQAVLPGATATDIWETAGRHWRQLPAHIVMSAEDMVDAALAGLDQGERITLPGMHDENAWKRYEAARQALAGKLSASQPAPRYRVAA
jgi:short-subunit dehydrogenase